MSVLMEMEIKSMGFNALDKEIKRAMRRSAKDAVQLGYMLRQMLERKLWEAFYNCFDEYLEAELHMEYSMANRFININRKYSYMGDSPDIDEVYEDYSQGLLIEMLSMPPELEAQVTPDMTVKQAREIKRKARQEKEAPQDDNIPGQASIEDFPEYMPGPAIDTDEGPGCSVIDGEYREIGEPEDKGAMGPEEIATSQPEAGAHDARWFVEQFVNAMGERADELIKICQNEDTSCGMGMEIQKRVAPYGPRAMESKEYSFKFWSLRHGIDMQIGDESINMNYPNFAGYLTEIAGEMGKWKSAYGLEVRDRRQGSVLSTPGCGPYDCFSCAQVCGRRSEDRYCVLAPLGNPFNCTTMEVLGSVKEEIGEKCQFINNGLARHSAGSGKAMPCCRDCGETCGYRCQRSGQGEDAGQQNTYTDNEPQDSGIDDEFSELRRILEAEKKLLNDYLKVGDLPERTVFRQKTIVAALAAMKCDLENSPTDPRSEGVV